MKEERVVSPDLVVVGELNIDLILEEVNALPVLEKERLATGMAFTLGSSSAILASNAAALDLSVGFVGRIGEDAFGDYVLEQLEKRTVGTEHILKTPEVATGVTAIFTHAGERGMITYPGAMEHLTMADMPWAYIEQADHLHLSSYYLQRGLRPDCAALFRRAKEKGLSTSLDTNWDPDEEWGQDVLDVLDYVDVFLPNDAEALLISGADTLDDAVAQLSRRAGTVVATCGPGGVRARSGNETYARPAPEVEPVDAVGAGDSFNAGFLSQYIAGESLERCLDHGLVAGAFSTQAAGGTAAFEDIDNFLQFRKDAFNNAQTNE